eukprot:9315149-Pyramimonas_sp.AAC.1
MLPSSQTSPSVPSTDFAKTGSTNAEISFVPSCPGLPSMRSRLRRSAYKVCHASTSRSANPILSR